MAELQPRRAQESIHHAGARLGGVVIVWVTIASSIGRRITQSMRGAVRMVQSSMHAELVSLVVAGVRARGRTGSVMLLVQSWLEGLSLDSPTLSARGATPTIRRRSGRP